MASILLKINEYVGKEVDFKNEVLLHDNGDGVVFIKEWNLDIPQPTIEELNAYESIADSNLKWKRIREKRNQFLAETDYLALSDNTMSAEMISYRQQLRDLPSSTSNPDDVVFPEKPEA